MKKLGGRQEQLLETLDNKHGGPPKTTSQTHHPNNNRTPQPALTRPPPPPTKNWGNNGKPGKNIKPYPIKRLTTTEMVTRRNNGLCYYCDELFTPGHKCQSKQLFMLVAEDEEDNGVCIEEGQETVWAEEQREVVTRDDCDKNKK